MIHLDSYGTSLAFDAATPEGLAEWDRLESKLRGPQTPLALPSRPLHINAATPLARSHSRLRQPCRNVTIEGNLARLTDELEQEIRSLGS
jgi:hypothetical protein